MNSLRALLSVFFAAFLLAGCSHFGSEEETAFEEGATPEQIILYQQTEREQLTQIKPIEQYNVSASSLSNENVQVYSVDGTTPAGSGLQATQNSSSVSGTITRDPSVQVFPLDDEMARSMGLMGVPSSMPMERVQPVEKIELKETGPVSLLPEAKTKSLQGPSQQPPPQDFVALNVPGNAVIRIYFIEAPAGTREYEIISVSYLD